VCPASRAGDCVLRRPVCGAQETSGAGGPRQGQVAHACFAGSLLSQQLIYHAGCSGKIPAHTCGIPASPLFVMCGGLHCPPLCACLMQGGEAAFITSMSRCVRWAQRGGKSNAYFAKTRDDRYIIKSLSKVSDRGVWLTCQGPRRRRLCMPSGGVGDCAGHMIWLHSLHMK
jgi:hypothetical protein